MTAGGARGPRVVVTGSTRGLGLAIAERLVAGGARVVVNGVDERRCREVGARLGMPSCPGAVDASGVADLLVDTCRAEFGGVDAVVNNAGITRDGMLTRLSSEDFDAVLTANLKGAWLVSQAAVKAMKGDGAPGAIINVISGTALFGNPGQSNYAAAKGGLLALTRSLSLELERFGVDVNAVAPIAETDMTAALNGVLVESGRGDLFGAPWDVAALFEHLCSPAARGMTGQVLSFDGRRLEVWSHPAAVATFENLDGWTAGDLAAVLEGPGVREELHPDRLGRTLGELRG